MRHRRFPSRGLVEATWFDGAVTAILLWWFGGANTSDDGYNMTVGRVASGAGYADNYFRYFGVPQDPFRLALPGHLVDDAGQRCGVVDACPRCCSDCWAGGSSAARVIPRLGRAVRTSTPAMWAGAFRVPGHLAAP